MGVEAGQGCAATEGGAEGVGRVGGEEVPEDLVRVLGVTPAVTRLGREAGGGLRAVELLRGVREGLVEHSQHL